MTNESGDPMFCLKDVCDALGLLVKKVNQRLEDEVLSKYPISDTIGRQHIVTFVNEDGLYDTILESRKPKAKKFRKWITKEVIPSIRKTDGSKLIPGEPVNPPLTLVESKPVQAVFTTGMVDIINENGMLYFCVADIAKCLDYSSPDHWNKWLRDDEVRLRQISGVAPGLKVTKKYVTESGLYRILIKCTLPKARAFEDWVVKEVIPSIRKTGSYSIQQNYQIPQTLGEALQLAATLQLMIEADAPKVEYHDKVLDTSDCFSISVIAKELGLTAIKLNQILHEKGIQYKQGKQWFLYEKYQDMGLTKTSTVVVGDDENAFTTHSTLWTETGRKFIHNLFCGAN